MGDNTAATNLNREILIRNLGLQQYKNTSIYTNNRCFVISPSSQNTYGWFDLRQINLDRFDATNDRGHLLVRFKDEFLWADLNYIIQYCISDESSVYTPSIGVHWKFNVVKDSEDSYIAVNRTGKQICKLISMSVDELKRIM
ncbi:hypothetical protein [Paenibacillus sp. FSL R7-0652]|uniref:hypothetical protein n=1 Tax=Paenibacillus sp. FSL R7-0652 TaxID=2921687 RepID=UPI00315AE074